ncbi:MAG: hypothetical protein ACP5MD_05515 [Verrucomicrobiia bacterium]
MTAEGRKAFGQYIDLLEKIIREARKE